MSVTVRLVTPADYPAVADVARSARTLRTADEGVPTRVPHRRFAAACPNRNGRSPSFHRAAP